MTTTTGHGPRLSSTTLYGSPEPPHRWALVNMELGMIPPASLLCGIPREGVHELVMIGDLNDTVMRIYGYTHEHLPGGYRGRTAAQQAIANYLGCNQQLVSSWLRGGRVVLDSAELRLLVAAHFDPQRIVDRSVREAR